MKGIIATTALSGAAVFGLAACGGSGGSPSLSQSQEPSSQVLESPPESAIQILQDDGFQPATIALPQNAPGEIDIAESPSDINNENNPQELVIVFSSPSAASMAAASERKGLANAGYTAVTVSVKDGGYAIVVRGSTSDFLKLGLG
jgi:hypothetical protein